MSEKIRAMTSADIVKSAVDFIETYYFQPIKVSDVAYEVQLSAWHLCHLFKEEMGVSLIDYLTHIRIERAKKLLLTTNKKCCSLFFEVGYNSQAYFARKFKEVVGVSPLQYRIRKGKVKN